MEIINTGDKPIYLLQLVLVPDLGKPSNERKLALTIQYGSDKLVGFELSTAEDVPIKPGETVFLKIRDMEAKGWDHIKKKEYWPEHWSKPRRVDLEFVELSFGDGTGFDPDGTPHKQQKSQGDRRGLFGHFDA